MNDTKVISFRAHKNLESWLVTAGSGFKGGKAEVLKLILTMAALEQPTVSGLGHLIDHIIGNSRQATIGNTRVYAVRLPLPAIRIIEDAVVSKHIGVSEWCASALFRWYEVFRQYKKTHREQDGWLTEYSVAYRSKIEELSSVYAQKTTGPIP